MARLTPQQVRSKVGGEAIYKIYAESFRGADHLRRVLEEEQAIVDAALAAPAQEHEDCAYDKFE